MSFWKRLITALGFLTVLRLGWWGEEWLPRSTPYFPLIGLLLGSLLALAAVSLGQFLPAPAVAAALLTLEVILTGGLHMDGVMDAADGLFSHRPRSEALEIMRDSRAGAHGVTAGVLVFLWKWSLFYILLGPDFPRLVIVALVLSRWVVVWCLIMYPYVRPTGLGKVFSGGSRKYLWAGTIPAAVISLYLAGPAALIFWAVVLGGGILYGNWICYRLGGMTGDTYGAAAELSEVAVLLTAAIALGAGVPLTW